jgi:ABC-type multidrug transport system permease subunit
MARLWSGEGWSKTAAWMTYKPHLIESMCRIDSESGLQPPSTPHHPHNIMLDSHVLVKQTTHYKPASLLLPSLLHPPTTRSAFFLAKTMTTTPIELVQVTVFAIITYYMFGFQATAAKFLIYWVTLVVFALCSETIGYMAAIVTPDSKVGVAVLSIFLLLLLAFSGYLVSRGQCLQMWGWAN